jgi:chemotaxis protein CheX
MSISRRSETNDIRAETANMSTLTTDLNAAEHVRQWVIPFVESTVHVATTMLNSTCHAGPILPVGSGQKIYELTSVIGMSGEVTGALSFSAPPEAAFGILERMTGIVATEIDELVRDVIGEMSNMIAGAGKRSLQKHGLKLGLPQVITGRSCVVYPPRWAVHYHVPFDIEFGPCSVDVGFDLRLNG